MKATAGLPERLSCEAWRDGQLADPSVGYQSILRTRRGRISLCMGFKQAGERTSPSTYIVGNGKMNQPDDRPFENSLSRGCSVALILIDPLASPYKNGPTTIITALEAANHTAKHGPDNGLSNYICNVLDMSVDYKAWIRAMPASKPKAIATYQSNFNKRSDADVNGDILSYGQALEIGQVLFHGGHWTGGKGTLLTDRPLSATFDPVVAYMNALWNAKAYDAGRLDLIVLKMTTATTKAFVFNGRGNLSHEREVLLPANTTLTFVSETRLRTDLNVTKVGFAKKEIPVYVIEVEVS